MKKGILIYTLMMSLVAISLGSCNKDDSSSSSDVIYGTSTTSALVTNFTLKENTKILNGLDSIHFTIDQDKKMIYNADSLPMGTDVSHLLCDVSFGTTVSKAEFVVGGGTAIVQDTTIKYSDSMTDSIDFTGHVTLNVTSSDGTSSNSYRIYVNVHQVEPDSIVFALNDRRDLPAAGDDNYAVGMAQMGDTYYSMVNNSNGRYLATAETPSGKWTSQKVTLPFTPVESSFAATTDAFYMLDEAGNLYTSGDALSWTSTGQVWSRIIGAYGDRLLGLSLVDGTLCNDEYPRRSDFTPTAIPEDFPVVGSSQLINETNEWTTSSVSIMFGGRNASGKVVDSVWGYDGKTWGDLNHSYESEVPALDGAILFRYWTYNVNSYSQHATAKASWVIMGGRNANGEFNRNTYISRDMGITWYAASTAMEIPSYMPSFYRALSFVCNEKRSVDKAPKRVSQYITEWDVPYVYIVGGFDSKGTLLNNVWKGTITRMTFKPVY